RVLELLDGPLARRMVGDVPMKDLAGSKPHDEEHVYLAEPKVARHSRTRAKVAFREGATARKHPAAVRPCRSPLDKPTPRQATCRVMSSQKPLTQTLGTDATTA